MRILVLYSVALLFSYTISNLECEQRASRPSTDCNLLDQRCLNGGHCVPVEDISGHNNGSICICLNGYTGARCEIRTNSAQECTLCRNGGTCTTENDETRCSCRTGFSGEFCEIAIDTRCKNTACPIDSKCVDGRCVCRNGDTGDKPGKCQGRRTIRQATACIGVKCGPGRRCLSTPTGVHRCIPITPIQRIESPYEEETPIPSSTDPDPGPFPVAPPFPVDSPLPTFHFSTIPTPDACTDRTTNTTLCRNGGTCVSATDGRTFLCHCQPGYTGEYCEKEMNECTVGRNPCLNSGTCLDGLIGVECVCTEGYGGLRCEIQLASVCQRNSCPHEKECVPSASDVNGYICISTTSNSSITRCTDNPCLNGAMCIDSSPSSTHNNVTFTCVCLPGFGGTVCESSLETLDGHIDSNHCPDVPDHCLNGGTCQFIDGAIACLCPIGFSGLLCEDDINECEYDPCKNRNHNQGHDHNRSGSNNHDRSSSHNRSNSNLSSNVNVNVDGNLNFSSTNNGNFSCVNTLGSYHCVCALGWTGQDCDIELTGCNSRPCNGENLTCVPTFDGGRHGYKCDCKEGLYGSNCSEDSTVSFSGNSLIYHLNPSTNSQSNYAYSIKLRLRTTVSNVIIAEGLDITPSVLYTVSLHHGRLLVNWTGGQRVSSGSHNEQTRSIILHSSSPINDGEWHGMELLVNSTSVQLVLRTKCAAADEILYSPKYTRPYINLPVFTTKFGGLTSSGKNYFIGCMQDIFVNGERVSLDGNVINVVKGCERTSQCGRNHTKCGGPSRGECIDQWDSYSCDCKRPYLNPDCSWELIEATFGYEGNHSYVEVSLDKEEKKSMEMVLDLSMIIRTRAPDGLLAYIGSNRTGNEYESFIILEVSEGRLKSTVQLGTMKMQIFMDEGIQTDQGLRDTGDHPRRRKFDISEVLDQISEEKLSIDENAEEKLSIDANATSSLDEIGLDTFENDRLDNGNLHLVRILRQEKEIRGFVDGVQVFDGKIDSPFPYPLLIDHFYLAGMPNRPKIESSGHSVDSVIHNDRLKRLPSSHQPLSHSFKGTIQDVRVNEAIVPLLARHANELVSHPTAGETLGDPVAHNVLEGTISDDLCRYTPCQNSGICHVTFNDYKCTCSDGWWGRNCTSEDVCVQRVPCDGSSKCHMMKRSEGGDVYVCAPTITLTETSWVTFHVEAGIQNEGTSARNIGRSDIGRENRRRGNLMELYFEIRTRSTSGTVLTIFGYDNEDVERPNGSVPRNWVGRNVHVESIEAIESSGQEDQEHLDQGGQDGSSAHEGRKEGSATGPLDDQLVGFLSLVISDAGFDLHYSMNTLNIQGHLRNITGGMIITDGQWHSILIREQKNRLTISVDQMSFDLEVQGDHVDSLRKLFEKHLQVHLGMAQTIGTVDHVGRGLKGCLREVRIGSDGWFLLTSQAKPFLETAAASRSGRIFVVNSSTALADGCRSDDVCHKTDEGTCLNGGTCRDEWNQFKCNCSNGFEGTRCETNIDECNHNHCLNGATCIDGIANYTCSCAKGYDGQFCERDIDECGSSPCQNNGTCLDLIDAFKCECSANYTGDICEFSVLVDCSSNPCQNGGECADVRLPSGHKTFNCTCPPAYYGRACERVVDFCEHSPCQNGGNCTSHTELLNYRCACPGGFTGVNCEENINECSQNPCIHGKCIDGWGNFTCQCADGWIGSLCDEDIDECQQSPCRDTGRSVCVNTQGNYSCQCPVHYFGDNCDIKGDCLKHPCIRGNCTDEPDGATRHCVCSFGYTGPSCEEEINFCLSNPCVNGGTCQRVVGGFHCSCILGFTGSSCEVNINECESNPCQNSGQCMDKIGKYVCNCNGTGFTGSNCQEDVDECTVAEMCVNSVNCKNSIGSYECICKQGYIGHSCSIRNPCSDNSTNLCQNGAHCFNPRIITERSDGIGVSRTVYDCVCLAGFQGQYCEVSEALTSSTMRGLEYILGPVAGGLCIVFAIVAGVFFYILRSKRANHGTYSPSRQETSGARMQLGSMMKPPPEERLI